MAGAAIVLLFTAGCSNSSDEPDTHYVAQDVESLYNAAKERLDRGDGPPPCRDHGEHKGVRSAADRVESPG